MPPRSSGPKAAPGVKNKFYLVTQDADQRGVHTCVWFGATFRESWSMAVDVVQNPVDEGLAVTDQTNRKPLTFDAEVVVVDVPLLADDKPPIGDDTEFDEYQITTEGVKITEVIPSQADKGVDRAADVRAALLQIAGRPLDVHTTRHGVLSRYCITNVGAPRTERGNTIFNISFIEVRFARAQSITITTIPRAKKQDKPWSLRDWLMPGADVPGVDESILYNTAVKDGGRVNPANPNSPTKAEAGISTAHQSAKDISGGASSAVTGVGSENLR